MKLKKPPDKSLFSNNQNKKDFFTIKTSLKSIIKNHEDIDTINLLVIETNDYVIRTYLFMRLYFLYSYYNKIPFIPIDKDSILYFMRTLATRDNRGVQPKNKELQKDLNTFYTKEFEPLINKPKFDFKNKTKIIPYAAIHIETSFKNNIKIHFITRFRRFLNIIKPNINIISSNKGKELDKEKDRFYNTIKNSILNDTIDTTCPNEYKEFAKEVRNNYLPLEYEKSFYYDCQKDNNINTYLHFMIKMNEVIEKRNNLLNSKIRLTVNMNEKRNLQKEVKKLFQIIPLRNEIIPHYMTFDKHAIKETFNIKEDNIWGNIFNTDFKVFKHKNYTLSTFHTDGVGVSLTFKRDNYKENKKIKSKETYNNIYLDEMNNEDLDIIKTKKLVVVDPGKKGICMLDDTKTNVNYTTAQRRKESLRKRHNIILNNEKISNNIISKETLLSINSSKTVNYEEFKVFIKEKLMLNTKVNEFYNQKLFRKLKFRTQIALRKSEDTFLKTIEEKYGSKEDIVIGYGDWSTPRQMKYCVPSINQGLKKIIEKKFKVFTIDEFRTSKLCSSCNKELKHYKMSCDDIYKYNIKNINTNGNKEIHRLLICSACSGPEDKKTTYWNRDINACVNMLKLSTEYINNRTRNKLFCRTQIDSNRTL